MTKIELVRAEMVKAMKAGDKGRKDALSALLTALKNVAIDKRADLTEEEENAVVIKEIKQLKETLESAPAGRTDIIDECNMRMAVLNEFAPQFMSEEEIKLIINQVLNDLSISEPTAKDKGKIMKELMPKVKGKADGNLVNGMVAGLFQA
jgi:uncharacterized protein YqeY